MTEYNATERCDEHKNRHEVDPCIWCQLDGLRKEIKALKLTINEVRREGRAEHRTEGRHELRGGSAGERQ